MPQGVEGEHVRLRQIRDVDVVAEARAVRRRIVVAEHLKSPEAERRVDRTRDHVGFRMVILTELTLGIGAGGVEVAKCHRPKAVGALVVRQRTFDRELGLAVRVDRLLRMILLDRRADRIAVTPRSRGKDRTCFTAGAPWPHRAPPARRSRCCGSSRRGRSPNRRRTATPRSA